MEGTAITAIISAVVALGGKYIYGFLQNQKAKITGDVEIAKATTKHEHYDKAIKELKNALEVIKELETELNNEKLIKKEIEAKYVEELNKEKQRSLRISEKLNSIKVILRIVIKQLQAEFSTDHTKLETLRDLEHYVNKE